MRRNALLLLSGLLAAAPVCGQSFNVDFGNDGSVPSAGYAAIGRVGAWNEIPVLPSSERINLMGLDGAMTTARIYMIGGTELLSTDDAGTSGDDQALMDDMLIGFNDPIDVCVFFENLMNGTYKVITYALTPNDPALLSRVRVDDATPGPQMVGGAWPGFHHEPITYTTHTLTITNGKIWLHSGLWDGLIQSGINGVQLIRQTAAAADEPVLRGGADLELRSVYPNPARATQMIELLAPAAGASGGLMITSSSGRLVWEGPPLDLPSGRSLVSWDGLDRVGNPVPSGVYYARFGRLNGSSATRFGLSAPIRLIRLD